MLRSAALVLTLVLVPFAAAHSETPPTSPASSPSPSSPPSSFQPVQLAQSPNWQPDLVSLGAGVAGFDKSEGRTHLVDMRAEYRWGYSLWSAQNDWLNFGIHPLAGFEFSNREQFYGFGGLGFDLLFWKHFVFTQSEAVGFFDSGNARPMGSFIEFRSQAELGWRFDNDVRMTAFIGHISNAGLTQHNPGEEIAGAYLHIPVATLFGR